MRDLKNQIRQCNIIPSDLPKWVFLEQTETVFGETETVFGETETVFGETKTISKWKRCSGHNGTAPIGQKCTENTKPKTLSTFRQHRFQI